MRWIRMRGLAGACAVAIGCGGSGGDTPDAPAPPDGVVVTPDGFTVTDPTDDDADGIADQLEDYLMATFGPELRLAPDSIDWTRPANVDWYLPKVRMRFDHPSCPDDSTNILDRGAITPTNIHAQQHYTKSSPVTLCRHNDGAADLRFSNKKHLEFFVQAEDDALVHPGIPPARSAEWRAYIQVRPSSYVRATDGKAAAYDLQVWFFYPYNDWIASANHEGDWEHMTISLATDLAIVSVFYATHNEGHRIDDLSKLQFVGATHVVGYAADGSHATYDRAGTHGTGFPGADDHTYDGGPTWQTWTNFVNLGSLDHVLHSQTWALYGGRWGEVGELDATSGPPGPMFNTKWDTRNEY